MQASEAPKLTIEEKQNFSKLPLSEKVKLTKRSILYELEETQGLSPKSVNINTNYLLELIDQFEYYKQQSENYFGLYCKQKARIHELEEYINELEEYIEKNDPYKYDVEKIVKAYQKKGYSITRSQAYDLWDHYSDSLFASWMNLPDNLDDIFMATRNIAKELKLI